MVRFKIHDSVSYRDAGRHGTIVKDGEHDGSEFIYHVAYIGQYPPSQGRATCGEIRQNPPLSSSSNSLSSTTVSITVSSPSTHSLKQVEYPEDQFRLLEESVFVHK